MKKVFASLLVAGLVALTGCNQGNTGGHPSSGSSGSRNPMAGHSGGFSLSVDKWTKESLKQGETDKVPVSISRDKDFHDDVKLSADNVPAGLSVSFDPPVFKGNEDTSKKVDMTIKAADTAPVGDHKFSIVGTTGKAGDNPYVKEVTVKVVAKESKK